ncbi:MAG: polysaccharide biosynthesis/export family protein [Candidatus Sumerlaeota bacterium]
MQMLSHVQIQLRSRIICLFTFLALVLLNSACSQKPPTFKEPPFPFEWRQQGRVPDAGLDMRPDYKVGVGDTLVIEAQRYPEFSGEAQVVPQGYIRLPYTRDEVMVAGLTLHEAEGRVREAIQPYVRLEPRLFVGLQEPNSKFIYVMGEVQRPGKYALGNEYVFVREAVARAGWPTRKAALKRGKVVSSKPERHATRKVNLKDIIYKGNLSENYKLQEGDVIWVPKNRIDAFVDTAIHWLRPLGVLLTYSRAAEDVSSLPDDFGDGNSGGSYGSTGYRY